MIDRLLQIVAPHYCYNCAKVGQLLCADCKYDIVDEANDVCIVCGLPSFGGICQRCQTSYEQAWFVGERQGPLQQLIDGLKFARVKGGARVIAELLDARLPVLPLNCVIVPVPTIEAHVRRRGYDHTRLIARELGRLRKIPVQSMLTRRHSRVQLGKSKQIRLKQMSTAFDCTESLPDNVIYLVVDDVVTTNATLRYCA